MLATAALLLATVSGSAGHDGSDGIAVIGHRGAGGLAPESSLPAFAAAIGLEVTAVELDVQITRDSVLIVHHDPRLDRRRCLARDGAALPRRPINRLRFQDLVGVDCGDSGVRAAIPRLEEVLALVRAAGYPVQVAIEIKRTSSSGPPAVYVAALVLEQVRRFGLADRTIIQSFLPEVLRAVHRFDPNVARAYLVRARRHYDRLLEQDLGTILAPKLVHLRRSDVERFHRHGVQVIPWTVNSEAEIRRAVALRVDGVISDYPDRVMQHLQTSRPAPGGARLDAYLGAARLMMASLSGSSL